MTDELMDDRRFANLNGANYRVRIEGSSNRVVLMIHGWPDDGRLWRNQIASIVGAGYTVVAPDLLGYGESDMPEDPSRCSTATMAHDMLSLIELLSPSETHLVAHDYGALVAWDMVFEAPDVFSSFAALSVGHPTPVAELSFENLRYHWYIALANSAVGPELYTAANGTFMRLITRQHPDGNDIVDEVVKHPKRVEAMRQIEMSMPLAEVLLAGLNGQLPDMPKCTVPTLGFWGEDEDVLPERQMTETEFYVDAEWNYHRVPEGGHWMMLTNPEFVTEKMGAWINRHSAPK